ncbi:flagellar motor protein MotB [Sulfurirhabdus autotrophica]|uniref:Chemotaxis protein MotB n=1 Tax=Sulfurirhabdus autotrophica TaxID=1706046 RepID=A0A4R3YHW0_9PROT|nr:flagellar motor protein MotB [Sulfurirhabdus autotrophica]TCV90193.1 chemotaxis protein MotB [Sulfurirhabdus autotrophica]
MSDTSQRPIIVKKIKKSAHGHHGGAWKIAYADFVTAMMAFFLLMWLLGSTAKGDLSGIAEYFKTPLKVALAGGSGSGDSSSVIKGGGQDLTRRAGQVKKGEVPQQKRLINLEAAKHEFERMEAAKLEGLKSKLKAAIAANPGLSKYKDQLLIDITSEGLRIQIVDEKNRPMFDSGHAALKPYTRDILHEIGKILNEVPNRVSLSGHTDATVYAGGEAGYSNWELSTERANASRRELIVGGMNENKMLRVVGLASAVLFDKENPENPINRRISIIVLNKKTEEEFAKESGPVQEVKPAEESSEGSDPVQEIKTKPVTEGALSGSQPKH